MQPQTGSGCALVLQTDRGWWPVPGMYKGPHGLERKGFEEKYNRAHLNWSPLVTSDSSGKHTLWACAVLRSSTLLCQRLPPSTALWGSKRVSTSTESQRERKSQTPKTGFKSPRTPVCLSTGMLGAVNEISDSLSGQSMSCPWGTGHSSEEPNGVTASLGPCPSPPSEHC